MPRENEGRRAGGERRRHAFAPTVQSLEGRALLSAATVSQPGVAPLNPQLTSAAGVLNPSLPLIRDGHVVIQHGMLNGVVLRFTHDMATGPVSDTGNYQVLELLGGSHLQPLTIPLGAANYHMGHRSVALVPANAVQLSSWARGIVVVSPPSPASLLTDTSGVPLDDTGAGRPSGQFYFALRLHGNTPGPLEYQQGLNQVLNSYRPYKLLNNVILPIGHVISPVPF